MVVFEEVLDRYGDVIVKNRAYLVEGVLQNDCERGIAIIAERVEPYTVRDERQQRVRLRRGVGVGPLGPTHGGLGAEEDEDECQSARATNSAIIGWPGSDPSSSASSPSA